MFYRNAEKHKSINRIFIAILVFVVFSFSLLFFSSNGWMVSVWLVRISCLAIIASRIQHLIYLHKHYLESYGYRDKYVLTFRAFLFADDVNTSHKLAIADKRERTRAENGILKRAKAKPTQVVSLSQAEPPTLSTEERHLQKLNELALDLRSITPLEHEEVSESIINDAMALPFEEGRVLLVNSYKTQRDRNRKSVTIPDDGEVVKH